MLFGIDFNIVDQGEVFKKAVKPIVQFLKKRWRQLGEKEVKRGLGRASLYDMVLVLLCAMVAWGAGVPPLPVLAVGAGFAAYLALLKVLTNTRTGYISGFFLNLIAIALLSTVLPVSPVMVLAVAAITVFLSVVITSFIDQKEHPNVDGLTKASRLRSNTFNSYGTQPGKTIEKGPAHNNAQHSEDDDEKNRDFKP